ncbi:Hef nuclease [Halobacteriales archaeon QH_10_67_13]|nr:MAG: Hef nuclease [Halobacteriales archaeon QH_10_67_13]
MAATVEWPLVATDAIERRDYQLRLAEAALGEHSLVSLPTGLGKTAVSLLVTARRLKECGPETRVLLLAPTKPLVTQHAQFYREALTIPDEEVVVFTGEVSPADRGALWEEARVVIATPQVVENDLVGNRISLADVVHCTFDECHRATGAYAYTYIADRYHEDADQPLVTGLSASPGEDEAAILEVCRNLGIDNVEVMTEEDADVAEYTHETTVEWKRVELPDSVEAIREDLRAVIRDRLGSLTELDVTKKTSPDLSERDLKQIQRRVQRLMDDDDSAGYQGMSLLAEIRKLRTALVYVETQSVEAFEQYMDRQREAARSSGASKADQRMVSDPKVAAAVRKAESYDGLHPKYRRARMLLAETLGIEGGERAIVFTESRDTAETLTAFLGEHFAAERFVGQSDTEGSEGMTQTEQQETLGQFRQGEFEVLVSTSVAEEGLDVPEVDLVLFYEPVPTAIRSIQRKGRTGRQAEGRVAVLLAEDTRDEAYFWKARQDEQEMESELRALKGAAGDIEAELAQATLGTGTESTDDPEAGAGSADSETRVGSEPGGDEASGQSEATAGETAETESDESGQAGLGAFADGEDSDDSAGSAEPAEPTVAEPAEDGGATEIVIDQRELEATIARDLSTRSDIETRLETLAVGDYVLSDRVVVERKTVEDFLATLTGGDRSLFEQVGDAARHYARPVVVIEGEDLYGRRNVHPKAIHGALASLTVDFGVSVTRTRNAEETADLLEVIANREQTDERREVSVHGEKQSRTLPEQQEYVVAAIAEVGPVTARSLLEALGSVEAVMTASEEELLAVEGVGEVTATRVREVAETPYEG